MSHAGPPSEPPQDPDQSGGQGESNGQPYNPYPDNWESGGTPSGPSTPPAPPNPYEQANPYDQPSPYGQPDPSAQQSPYGQPNPYAQQPPHAAPGHSGQPGQPGGPANPYAGPSTSKPTFGFAGYAGWLTRVGAYLIDYVASLVAALPLWVGYAILIANTSTTTNADGSTTSEYSGSVAVPVILIAIGAITSIVFFVWNICIRQGRTGASVGKSVLAIRLVNSDLQTIGAGWSFLRYVLHIVDAIPCYLGYLWPIWDSRKQTFADKIMNTFVIHATAPQPPSYPPPPPPYQTY